MTKFYIQQELQEPITEVVFDSGTADGDFTIFDYEAEDGAEDDDLKEIRVEICKGGTFYIAKSNIDLFIQALQKAKEVWGE